MKPVMAVIVASALGMGFAPRPVDARMTEAAVTSLSVIPAPGKAEVVIGVAGETEVRDFTLDSPHRIVLDLSGVSLGALTRSYDRVTRGGILDVRYSQFRRGTVRVVLYLDGSHAYRLTRGDGEVRVSVAMPAGMQFGAWHAGNTNTTTQLASNEARPVAEKPVAERSATESRPVAGEPPRSGPDRAIDRAVADHTAESRAAESRYAADAPVLPARTVMQQVRQQGQAIPQRSQQAPITVTFLDSDIRDVIASFAAFSGRTIIPSSAITATKVNAEIKNQPWDVALAAILASQGLAAQEDANGIIIVDTQERLAARAETEPLRTQLVRLNYQRATPVADQIKQRVLLCIPAVSGGQSTTSPSVPGQPPTAAAPNAQPTSAPGVQPSNRTSTPLNPGSTTDNSTCRGRGSVTADETTNTVSITAPSSQVDELVNFAQRLDLRQPVVNIKAKIVLVNRTDLDALGIKYDLGSANQFFNTVIQRSDSLGNPLAPTSPPIVSLGGNTVSAIGNASGTIQGAALRLIYSTALGNFDFSTFLDALQEVNLLDVQAEPSVTTTNNKTATLVSGVQVPFVPLVSSGGVGTTLTGPVTVERVQTGVTLDVTPSVTNNRQISMHVEVTNSDVSFTNNGTLIDNNSTKNDLLVADGQTVVIGGLTQTSVRVTKSGIPLLVDLPFIGRLFGYTTRQEQRRDLLVLITPHIVDEGQTQADVVRP